jgi:hypothetical protein
MTKRHQRRDLKQVPKDKQPKFVENDEAIIRAVYEARYLSADLIIDLLFRETLAKWAYGRLRDLYDLKFLDKRVTFANLPDVYFLGLQGRRYFKKLGCENVDETAGDSGGTPLDTLLWMRHDLTVSKLYVWARLEAARRGWEMEWKNARVLEVEKLGVQPDGWIRVGKPGQMFEGYIEFTNQLTSRAEIEKKIRQYQGRGNVLWFTTTEAKLRAIQPHLTGHYALALVEEAKEWLTAPIWHWQGQKRSWITATSAGRGNLD